MMKPYDEKKMAAHTINRLVNNSRTKDTNVPEVSAPVDYPELALMD